jgi:hypothetical protein
MKIVEIRQKTIPIPARSATRTSFSKMTLSLVAVVTDVMRDGKPVVGYGFNSNGRYGQGKLMRERHPSRDGAGESLLDAGGKNLDPHKIWNTVFTNEKTRQPRRGVQWPAPVTWRYGTQSPRPRTSRSFSCC